MDRRKSLRKNVAVEGVNDSVYIHPQKFRDKNMQVSNCSSLPLLAEVRDLLSVDEKAIFKGTSIGHLLSVPANSKFSGTIVHFLHSREIHVDDKPDEMHFKVGGKILHFGKREFALITGLSFKKPERAFVSPANPPSLMTAHFPNHNCVSASTLKAFLSEKNSNCSSLDRVKLALLLVVHNFLMSRQLREPINISYWHLVDDLEVFNKYPWGEVAFNRITKFTSPLLHQANKKNNCFSSREPHYQVVGIANALLVWALEIMPGLLNLCGRKIESRGWRPHMLCVLCKKSPNYPTLIKTLEVNDVHVRSDIVWQKGDGYQLIELGLEEGTPELNSFIRTEKEFHKYHEGESLHEREDGNQSGEVLQTAPRVASKKRKTSIVESHPYDENLHSSEPLIIPALPILMTQESVAKGKENNIPHTSVEDSRGEDAHTGNMSSCSGAKTMGVKSLEVDEHVQESVDVTTSTSTSKGMSPDSTLLNISTSAYVISSPPGFTGDLTQERIDGFEFVDNFKIPEEHAVLYRRIYEKHGHMATKKVIKFNDDMLVTCVTSLLKIISEMENVRGSELSEALLERWEGSIKDAESLEFNVKWLLEGFNRLKDHWRSSFGIDEEVETNAQGLNAMHVYLSTREEELGALLLEVKIQKRKAEETISSERKTIKEKLNQKIKFQNESIVGFVLS